MCKACTNGIGMAKRKSKTKNKDLAMNAVAAGLGLATARVVGAILPVIVPDSLQGSTMNLIVGGVKAGAGVYITASSKSTNAKAFGVGMAAGGAVDLLAPVINPVVNTVVTTLLPGNVTTSFNRINGPSGSYKQTISRGRVVVNAA